MNHSPATKKSASIPNSPSGLNQRVVDVVVKLEVPIKEFTKDWV
jgi:hypothetical protein